MRWRVWFPVVLPWVYRAVIVLAPILLWREIMVRQREIGRRTLLLEQAVASAAHHKRRADSLAAIVLPAQVDTVRQVMTRWRQGRSIVDTLPPDTVRIPTPVFIAREVMTDSAFVRCERALSTCDLAIGAKDSVIRSLEGARALLPATPRPPGRRVGRLVLAGVLGLAVGALARQ